MPRKRNQTRHIEWESKYEGTPQGEDRFDTGFRAFVVKTHVTWEPNLPDDYEWIKVDKYSIVEQKSGYEVLRHSTTTQFGETYSGSETIAEGVGSLAQAKKVAREDMEWLLAETERLVEQMERAERERKAGLSGFNLLFEEHGSIREGYRGPQRHMNIELVDGTAFSVTAGGGAYSSPSGEQVQPPFKQVEVGFPTREIPELMRYIEPGSTSPTQTVYPYVPVEVIEKIIQQSGGYTRVGDFSYERTGNPQSTRKLKSKLLR